MITGYNLKVEGFPNNFDGGDKRGHFDLAHDRRDMAPMDHTRVYRAVGEAEYQDILDSGRFRVGPNSLEGKWFADSLEGARAHGNLLYPGGKFHVIRADVPDNAPSLFKQPNLDQLGAARYLHIDDLKDVMPRPVS